MEATREEVMQLLDAFVLSLLERRWLIMDQIAPGIHYRAHPEALKAAQEMFAAEWLDGTLAPHPARTERAMSEREREALRREVPITGKERLFLHLADHGMYVWLGHSDWPHGFPLPVTDEDWPAVRDAIESIRAEAKSRAKMENAFQQLVDPIDGPNGEA